jgi:hypothetical protein
MDEPGMTQTPGATVPSSDATNEETHEMSTEDPAEDVVAEPPETKGPQKSRIITTAATSTHPAIIEPRKPVDGPVVHLYTSLSSGSSYVRSIHSLIYLGQHSTTPN